METRVAYCEACELARVLVHVLTAVHRQRDQPMLLDLALELVRMPADVSDQVAHLAPHPWVFVFDQTLAPFNHLGLLDLGLLVFGQSSQVAHQTQHIQRHRDGLVLVQKVVFVEHAESVVVHELLGKDLV